jgi:hypothetical protein
MKETISLSSDTEGKLRTCLSDGLAEYPVVKSSITKEVSKWTEVLMEE